MSGLVLPLQGAQVKTLKKTKQRNQQTKNSTSWKIRLSDSGVEHLVHHLYTAHQKTLSLGRCIVDICCHKQASAKYEAEVLTVFNWLHREGTLLSTCMLVLGGR